MNADVDCDWGPINAMTTREMLTRAEKVIPTGKEPTLLEEIVAEVDMFLAGGTTLSELHDFLEAIHVEMEKHHLFTPWRWSK
jgi:hypothetical protein